MIRNDSGEAAVAVAIVGALATASPAVVVMSGAESAILRTAAVVLAVTAIGAGVGALWRLARSAGRKLDSIDAAVSTLALLQVQVDRIEARQVAMQDQTRDNSHRLHNLDGLEPS